MKILTLIFSLSLFINAYADVIIIDDFSTGGSKNTTVKVGSTDLYQTGNMVGRNRMLTAHITEQRDSQNLQVAVVNNKLVASFSYNTVGVIRVNYGSIKNGLKPMALDFVKGCKTTCSTLNIEFDGTSSDSGLYVSLFTNSDRAVWRDHVKARPGIQRVTIPLSKFNVIGANFTLKQVDYIRLQFDSRAKTGLNFAVNRIWVQ